MWTKVASVFEHWSINNFRWLGAVLFPLVLKGRILSSCAYDPSTSM